MTSKSVCEVCNRDTTDEVTECCGSHYYTYDVCADCIKAVTAMTAPNRALLARLLKRGPVSSGFESADVVRQRIENTDQERRNSAVNNLTIMIRGALNGTTDSLDKFPKTFTVEDETGKGSALDLRPILDDLAKAGWDATAAYIDNQNIAFNRYRICLDWKPEVRGDE